MIATIDEQMKVDLLDDVGAAVALPAGLALAGHLSLRADGRVGTTGEVVEDLRGLEEPGIVVLGNEAAGFYR